MPDKKPRNEKGELHGPYQYYWLNGRLWEKSHYVNGVAYGYHEISQWLEGEPKKTFYYCR